MSSLSNGFVCVMGMGTVFVGLICIVFICMLMSVAVKAFSKNAPQKATATPAAKAAAPQAVTLPPAEKQAIIAGVCAVIAEEIGTDVSNIKVLSFKKA